MYVCNKGNNCVQATQCGGGGGYGDCSDGGGSGGGGTYTRTHTLSLTHSLKLFVAREDQTNVQPDTLGLQIMTHAEKHHELLQTQIRTILLGTKHTEILMLVTTLQVGSKGYLTHSLTHSLTYTPTFSRIDLFTHPLTHSPT